MLVELKCHRCGAPLKYEYGAFWRCNFCKAVYKICDDEKPGTVKDSSAEELEETDPLAEMFSRLWEGDYYDIDEVKSHE